MEERLHYDRPLMELVQSSAGKVGPQIRRFSRALETAAKSEIRIYLRENGVTEDLLTDEEYDFIIAGIERKPPADERPAVARFGKRYLRRQLGRFHDPRKTARYLSSSYRDTLVYFLFFVLYTALVYGTCHRMPWVACVTTRLVMTFHLGYFHVTWINRIARSLAIQLSEFGRFSWKVARYLPGAFFEVSHVLFDVFLGWPLLGSISGMFFMVYVVPIAFPEMALSSVFVDLHGYLSDGADLPSWAKLATLFV